MNGIRLKIILLVSFVLGCLPIAAVDPVAYPTLFLFLRMLGQPALVIACFLLVEGFLNTKNRGAYFARLLVFGIAGEFPFLMFSVNGMNSFLRGADSVFGERIKMSEDYWNNLLDKGGKYTAMALKELYNSCARSAICGLMTLAFVLLLLCVFEKIFKNFYDKNKPAYYCLSTLCIIGFLMLLTIFPFEANIKLVLFSVVFYLQRGNKPGIAVLGMMMTIFFYADTGLMVSSGAVLGLLLVMNYNGKRYSAELGEKVKENPQKEKIIKYAFYAAYPLTYLVFWGLGSL